MAKAKLWLFDIDGTLVDTGGAGLAALNEATERYFGESGPALDLAGATDSGLVAGLFEYFGRPYGDGDFEAYCAVYLERLEWNLMHGGFPGIALPGAGDLLDHLAGESDIAVGLLTGNVEAGALAKMRHFGMAHHFGFGAYGCDHSDRNRLGPVALERAGRHTGRTFSPEETLVIGDTPKDIACAAAMGARCLAVATGAFGADGLGGADQIADSLEDESAWGRYL
ncbi:HAD hydrolase-like protein [Haloferula rosea]|uniref:phosphoglycolate phosphatase n=1 Tax=Haloferula rosea TaxID=490093 RepID=A0A934RB41_9BACT|nr:HAD hydrolase-like protein [Haloferula rosea]MBK1826362.1 HAD hydrolase-like protein [Haloferula rosea]